MYVYSTAKLVPASFEAMPRADAQESGLLSIEGTIQRIDYRKRTFALVAESRVWHFTLSPDSQLWFNRQLTNFRCFHPLDNVRVFYELHEKEPIAQALSMWAEDSESE